MRVRWHEHHHNIIQNQYNSNSSYLAMIRTRYPRGAFTLGVLALLFFHVLRALAGTTHHQPWLSSRWSERQGDSSAVTRHDHHLWRSRSCCFSTSSTTSLLSSFIASPTAVVHNIGASQPITATSLFFQRRWKIKRPPFLLPGRSIPSSQYAPDMSSCNSHVGISRQLIQRRGGAAAEMVMSPIATTEESASSSIASNNNIQEGGCNNNNTDDDDKDEDKQNKLILIHTYNCTTLEGVNDTISLMGLGMPKRQFATWVRYYLSNSNDTPSSSPPSSSTTAELATEIDEIVSNISTQQVDWENDWENHIVSLRQYWKDGKLLCEHTNLLNDRGGMSRIRNKKIQQKQKKGEQRDKMNGSDSEEMDDEEEQQMKYEQFRNILGSYADRLVNIVEDELSDANFIPRDVESTNISSDDHEAKIISELLLPRWNTRLALRGWIENEYGAENTRGLLANELLVKSEREQLETFQTFLDWFRSKFPYFHDACDVCGASCKDVPLSEEGGDDEMVDSANGEIIGSNNVQEETDVEKLESYQHEDDKDNDNFSFVGYIGPSPAERLGNASRTELYRCRSCSAFTRFPRYNKALWVTQTRRGRCGEYSMLLYRMLRALGYKKIRWVVDWADHVWVEALLGDGVGAKSLSDAMEDKGRWVHLDPCEAAVDNPLLYSSWGKNQTYLMAFYDPSVAITSTSDGHDSIQAVEDVTLRYTKDAIGVVTERRGIPEQAVAEAIKEVSCKTVSMLKSVVARS